jgi:ABC-type dipeptide/oligopeptide/nickel transport system ATPase component
MVMQDGEVREHGTTATVFEQPSSTYTRELLASVPDPSRRISSSLVR